MLRILVSNDDGIEAFGIRTLVRFLSHMAEVYVVAPDKQRSASGQAITLSGKVTAKQVEMDGALKAIALTGTPADCAKYGIDMMREAGTPPDFVIGGINHGGNAGIDINYSGTFAIANEGALNGYRALVLSVTNKQATHFEFICEMIPEILDMTQKLQPGIILNVNAPDLPKWQIKGVRYAEAGICGFNNTFERVIEKNLSGEDEEHANKPFAEGEYKYNGELTDGSAQPSNTDLNCLANGYATITPYKVNRVDNGMLAKLRGLGSDNTMCIIMDVQNHIIPEVRKSEKFMDSVLKLARCLSILELPTLLTEQYGYDTEPISGELKSELRSFEKLDKVEFDCTSSQDMESLLASHKGRRIVLAGLEAHIGILQSARSLIEKGYEVQILKDCCASKQKEDLEEAMKTLRDMGCTITTLESFIYEEIGSTTDFAYRKVKTVLEA
ncbi:5'/3'-nucleotidase SurE [Mogibacterium pumilum]|uniref:5'-nucleotidase SurE n=1 Tax=Mogibacterium pumilum TaxID=86332 RepID=A0A223AQF8_9FIRM|nr:5'/3'-nucleotidase SurE [Mogibacterium pumilum]ASS37185.1 5'/3'-nucleotidase SurE [Mogibacterium pumilum]